MACVHCRAEAQYEPDPQQLTTVEGKALLEDIASFAKPVVIMTGGEPLMREDIFELCAYGDSLGLRMAISPDDGRLLTPETVARLKASGVRRASFSLHYTNAEQNDYFARTDGAFANAMRGLANMRVGGLPFQINTTVTKLNVDDLPAMLKLVQELGAQAWHVFLLVPTGRGKAIESQEIPPEQYESTLNWLYDMQQITPIEIKETCAPHFRRIQLQRRQEQRRSTSPPEYVAPSGHGGLTSHGGGHPHGAAGSSRGCMSGDGFCFVSHIGEVFGCGYLPVLAGNVRERPFREIYQQSSLFKELRDLGKLKGKCGRCEYRQICGGCRARAYAATGDYLADEPYCIYEPGSYRRKHSSPTSQAGTLTND